MSVKLKITIDDGSMIDIRYFDYLRPQKTTTKYKLASGIKVKVECTKQGSNTKLTPNTK